ncbi:MAG: hypothetical protein JWN15_1074 [Firmicutes bacterium]|nr:hypothetical protein [Bacillota bacterium]
MNQFGNESDVQQQIVDVRTHGRDSVGSPVAMNSHGQERNATAGFVLGLVSLLAWILPFIGLPVTVTGLVLSIRGLRSSRSGLATAGLILSVIWLLVTLANGTLGAYMYLTGQYGK